MNNMNSTTWFGTTFFAKEGNCLVAFAGKSPWQYYSFLYECKWLSHSTLDRSPSILAGFLPVHTVNRDRTRLQNLHGELSHGSCSLEAFCHVTRKLWWEMGKTNSVQYLNTYAFLHVICFSFERTKVVEKKFSAIFALTNYICLNCI